MIFEFQTSDVLVPLKVGTHDGRIAVALCELAIFASKSSRSDQLVP